MLLTEITIKEILKDMSIDWICRAGSISETNLLRYHTIIFVYCVAIITSRVLFGQTQLCMVMWCSSWHVSASSLQALHRNVLTSICRKYFCDRITPFLFQYMQAQFLYSKNRDPIFWKQWSRMIMEFYLSYISVILYADVVYDFPRCYQRTDSVLRAYSAVYL